MKIDGLPVKDAKKKIAIYVTRTDIESGKSKAPESCAAAKAAVRQIPRCTEARVHLSRTYLKIGSVWYRYMTPDSLRVEVISFDRGVKFSPSVYVLSPQPMAHRARMGKSHSKGVPKKSANPKKRIKPHKMVGVRSLGWKDHYKKDYK